MPDTKLLIAELSPVALHRLADYYRSASDELRAAAEQKAAALGVERDAERRLSALASIPDLVAGYRVAGLSRDAACDAAAVAAGVALETVHAWLRSDARELKTRQAETRSHAIAQAIAAGRTQRQIAQAFGVSQSTVSRIARKFKAPAGDKVGVRVAVDGGAHERALERLALLG